MEISIPVKKIKGIDCYDSIPNGWKIIQGAVTAPKGYTWISNNKSHFSGQRKTGLVPDDAIQSR